MKISVNGIVREMTSEEISEVENLKKLHENDSELPPTYEDRLSALESALLEMITGGETDD